ncbi:hypothetical protein F0L68_39740 [Solihabitans fulvus]|uniref:Uncharacterized protein n=1 Tax=Solihabitans fulvus TaxID=1892852 RepID=A0A5B2WBS2_9PSEU|nr:hypothetical protein [Solihabitans fulvus]KAA2248684.1 hypothetical protein F0L68_39740 [Solihabitans fulvus]
MSWLLCLFAFGMLFLLKKKWRKWRKWWVVATFAALGACAFANTDLGGWVAGLLRTVLGVPAGWIHTNAALLAALAVLICIPLVVYGFVHDRKADRAELVGLIVLPLLFIIASGPVADHGGRLADAFSSFGRDGLSYLVQGKG